ncbi:MAG TPA: HAMP domain-containing sensor histidine kinase [Kofleriaceae bacterium]|nr:HAMP domain-containing sensor histidine kinase [Kofleriaceae bacterium]
MAMIEDVREEYQQADPEWERAELVQLRRVAAIMAHEVRNPLTGMGGALQVIKERMPRNAPDRPVIDEIQRRLYALNAVVDRLQEYATVEHPRLQLVSVREVLRRSTAMLHEDGRFGAVSIALDGTDATLEGDYALLVRLFYSLLVNAAQSRDCAAVTVTVTAATSACQVSILDDGPGIGDTERELVFVPFFTTRSQGLGLGLATARRIAASHGGRVWCASGTASGTEMVVSLPCIC